MVWANSVFEKDIPGTIGCAVCFGLQFLLIVCWRVVLTLRNKRRNKAAENDGLTEEERAKRAKEFGESDATDFENTYVSLVLLVLDNGGYRFANRCV